MQQDGDVRIMFYVSPEQRKSRPRGRLQFTMMGLLEGERCLDGSRRDGFCGTFDYGEGGRADGIGYRSLRFVPDCVIGDGGKIVLSFPCKPINDVSATSAYGE
jgi:hypothetical protein